MASQCCQEYKSVGKTLDPFYIYYVDLEVQFIISIFYLHHEFCSYDEELIIVTNHLVIF